MNRSYRYSSKPVIRNKTASFLARIQSSYWDETQKKWRVIQGLGTFVNLKLDGVERTAVISVSHVTQGQQIRIYDSKGEILPILPGHRLANIDDDVEMIVLKDRLDTPLKEFNDRGLFVSEFLPIDQKLYPKDMEYTDYDRIYVAKKQHVPILRSLLPKNSSGQNYISFSQDRETIMRNFLMTNKLEMKPGPDLPKKMFQFLRDIWDVDGTLQSQLMGDGYIANARMLPGLSGAPLIRDAPWAGIMEAGTYLYMLEGIVQGHHRFENKSYFVGIKSIRNVVESFRKGQRSYTSQTRWRLRDGSTFRDYGNGVLETTMIKMPSASFYKGESGNAISVDGDINPTSINLGVGIQNGYGSSIVGQYVEIDKRTFPILADPHVSLPQGMTLKKSFGGSQDLLALAQMKTGFQDLWANYITNYECFYQVTPKGIDLQVNKFLTGDRLLNWNAMKETLNKGFQQNNLIVKGNSGISIETSGLFMTDLTSMLDVSDARLAGVPTVTVIPSQGEPEKVGCYSSPEQRKHAYDKYREEMAAKLKESVGADIPLPQSPFDK